MFKLILGLGLIDIAISHPLLVALLSVVYFIYENVTEEEMKTVWSNGQRLLKFIQTTAEEMGVSVNTVREFVFNKVNEYKETPEEATEEVPAAPNPNEIVISLADHFTAEEINELDTTNKVEVAVRSLKDELSRQDSGYWPEDISPKELFLLDVDPDYLGDDLGFLYEQQLNAFTRYVVPLLNVLEVDSQTRLSEQGFRQLFKNLKATNRLSDGSIADHDLQVNMDAIMSVFNRNFLNYRGIDVDIEPMKQLEVEASIFEEAA